MKRPGWFFGFLGVLILVWSLTPFWVPRLAYWFLKPEPVVEQNASASQKDQAARASRDHAISGEFGEMFGTINSLFSGIALIGVAYGLYLQIEQKRREKQPEVFARLAA